jgi:DNA-binding response OmpR family regulator
VAENREIEVALDAPDEPVLVEGDKGKLGQVFNNLLSNAVKFNHHGGRVEVAVHLTEDNVETIVSDTGIGIPQDALDKVFSRFYQYDSSSTRKYGGAGIGLSISQDIVRLHGGRMTVSSEEGQGATFRFTLPLRSRRRQAEERGGEPAVPETNLLVELVTADRALCSQFRVLLDAEGVDLVVAGTVPNAIALAEKHHPDCIVVDLEAAPVGDSVLDELLESKAAAACPLAVFAGDEARYSPHEASVAARIKPGFRKSGLLSTIHYTISAARATDAPLARRVLVVDDDPEIRDFIQVLLEAEDIEVEPSDSGEEALEKAAQGGYGLVLLDIAMPGMDGWETSRRIKALPNAAGIKVYMVTAKPIESFDVRSSRSGADGYLLKPFKGHELVELVQGLLGAAPRASASS